MFSANSSQVSEDRLYVEDVFSTWLYTGNGSTQTITNGIDLSGKGGMVWIKSRSNSTNHMINDTARGANKQLYPNLTNNEGGNTSRLTAFNSNGFNLSYISTDTICNENGYTYASWTFRKAPKFFDVVTYSGNSVGLRQISHNLGVEPGCIIVKETNNSDNWWVYHRGTGTGKTLNLNTTAAVDPNTLFSAVSSTTFTPGSSTIPTALNVSGSNYVAYLFAHDTTSDGIIQCGSFTNDGSGNATVNLGWEPQWLLLKKTAVNSNWQLYDNMRGFFAPSQVNKYLYPNSSGAENGDASKIASPTATGFTIEGFGLDQPVIYIAIRRGPMRTPTSGTSVFSPVARTGTGATAQITGIGFPPDLAIGKPRTGYAVGTAQFDRLRGTSVYLAPSWTDAEISDTTMVTSFNMDGISLGADTTQRYFNGPSGTYINWLFRRAPSFFDVVCYTGTGSATTFNHNLGVAPELMIVKQRNGTNSWAVYAASQGASKYGLLNSSVEFTTTDASYWNSTNPTSSVFSVGTQGRVNGSGSTYVAYLFASCPGVSKVGSYVGNDTTQTIDCGFSSGARFVMIKGVSGGGVGDWYVWDTARGIIASNDPHLSLNSTAAEVATDDTIDPTNSGFIVNQNTATYANYTGTTYIYLAVA